MAENLNYEMDNRDRYGSYCYDDDPGDDDPGNCDKYGRLYTWIAAMNACPEGWHLPSKVEFEFSPGSKRTPIRSQLQSVYLGPKLPVVYSIMAEQGILHVLADEGLVAVPHHGDDILFKGSVIHLASLFSTK